MNDHPTDHSATNANLPENELGHRRHVIEHAATAATCLQHFLIAIRELHELGVPAIEWLSMVVDARAHPIMDALVARIGPMGAPFIDGALAMAAAKHKDPEASTSDALFGSLPTLLRTVFNKKGEPADQLPPVEHPMADLLDRLFDEAPKMTGPDGKPDESQAPAVQCHVLLKGAMQPLFGALSTTPEGLLRILTPAKIDGRPILAESFFSIGDIVSIMVEREVKGEQSRIVTS